MAATAAPGPGLPLSALFALWFNAMTSGACSPDETRDAVIGGDAAHDVLGLPGQAEPVPLILALGRLAKTGSHAGIALPVPGDPLGLAGPADFNADAMEAGEAVVFGSGDVGLVPARAGAGVVWSYRSATSRRQVPDRSEAGALLRSTLLTTVEELAGTAARGWPMGGSSDDVGDWADDRADDWADEPHAAGPSGLPPGTDPRVVSMIRLATRCRSVVAAGLNRERDASGRPDGQRQQALVALDRAARRALVAACEDAGP